MLGYGGPFFGMGAMVSALAVFGFTPEEWKWTGWAPKLRRALLADVSRPKLVLEGNFPSSTKFSRPKFGTSPPQGGLVLIFPAQNLVLPLIFRASTKFSRPNPSRRPVPSVNPKQHFPAQTPPDSVNPKHVHGDSGVAAPAEPGAHGAELVTAP